MAASLFKLVLVLTLCFIIFNLGRALVVMVKGKSDKPASHFLGRRLIFSALVIVFLLIALQAGWIEPNPRPY
ncbi:DUF2909 domain-containing protein [Vibrio sp. vnigr-6D03]|uniref:DUF2909 domain-containing protein n=2 Tax=Vibrio penaeicida TaxID=104609 RepID=A0AAV5NZR2_9VIBR|nr:MULTISPECIES: DUF2909 domain-containing protein [Vibrio]MBD1556243.1 DUF2909 domain-containing protein [Vibrio sp. S9_S30]PKF79653.1 DUF2909 domain-containing protein [Vibrio sp. vnigr-6D03]RTZ23705.1 DUF2909 domain-containing protein [Vibrio penaeicida]GLQ75799.1 hypothetical protein GCM10007932_51620 [Vibrio penaeicida]